MDSKDQNFEELGKILSGESHGSDVPQDIQSVWDAASSYTYKESSDNDASWLSFKDKIVPAAPLKVSWMKRYSVAVAAAIALLLVSGVLVWKFSVPQNESPNVAQVEIIKTTGREIKTINLPDGSIVTLNSNSTLTVGEGFNNQSRSLVLTGQAVFEVAKNENLPFVVKAGNSITTVLGTGFDIEAYAGEAVKILVKHGKVRFGSDAEQLILLKGNAASLDASSQKPKAIAGDTNGIAWQKDGLVFKRSKLSDVAAAVKHRYGKSLVFSAALANRVYTGKFEESASIESIAQVLSETFQTEVTVE